MTPGDTKAYRWARIVEAGKPEGEAIFTYPLETQPKNSEKYQIFRGGQNFDLMIRNLDFYDGGLYLCQDVLTAQTKGAPLVVLSKFYT